MMRSAAASELLFPETSHYFLLFCLISVEVRSLANGKRNNKEPSCAQLTTKLILEIIFQCSRTQF
ncbi:hypothetical protein PHSC3_000549 [Chlamydiales bacterium STE3]|nr:hypothetical protein PHSC3_000549 [Chlamydiales bacterium STE3]